jgi:bacillithiol system protein YtxJ
MIRDLEHKEDFERLVQQSYQAPVLLLKHSTRCPISRAALRECERFCQEHPDVELWRVLVIENKPLSAEIARATGVMHQSPQLLLLSNGQVTWHVSHWAITEKAVADAYDHAA